MLESIAFRSNTEVSRLQKAASSMETLMTSKMLLIAIGVVCCASTCDNMYYMLVCFILKDNRR